MLTENQKTAMRRLFEDNGLNKEDVFTHKHYTIITRSGIEKIQFKSKIAVRFEVVNCQPDFCVVKAKAYMGSAEIETFGSAKHGHPVKEGDKWRQTGTTDSWYVMEIAEKRALSRAVLKIKNLYELEVFGEDETMEDGLDR